MKMIIMMMFALVAITSCGNKTKVSTNRLNSAASDAESTVVNEVPDTLNTVEAVVKQVDAVYAYWNELRQHYDENKPSIDELFGSKEWLPSIVSASVADSLTSVMKDRWTLGHTIVTRVLSVPTVFRSRCSLTAWLKSGSW